MVAGPGKAGRPCGYACSGSRTSSVLCRRPGRSADRGSSSTGGASTSHYPGSAPPAAHRRQRHPGAAEGVASKQRRLGGVLPSSGITPRSGLVFGRSLTRWRTASLVAPCAGCSCCAKVSGLGVGYGRSLPSLFPPSRGPGGHGIKGLAMGTVHRRRRRGGLRCGLLRTDPLGHWFPWAVSGHSHVAVVRQRPVCSQLAKRGGGDRVMHLAILFGGCVNAQRGFSKAPQHPPSQTCRSASQAGIRFFS
ncbi:hypothetical protein Q4I28_000026 [Leishmania naiffi]|uniref:Uncharacterized protein n=1 Tax=Leishmania naiffi TaxID=5678 RepID=A0AAW3CCA9_9TRYP